jgi:hypothetical protein
MSVALFLLVYDQRRGALLAGVRPFSEADADAAVAERFRLEREHRADVNVEVVLLGASSEEQLRKTHRRYFMTPAEMAASALA